MLDLGQIIDDGQADSATADEYCQWWSRPGRVILGEHLGDQDTLDDEVYTGQRTPGALTIIQTCGYDPGNQAYRFHSAVNHTTPHGSMFARVGNNNPYTNYRQIDCWRYRELLMLAVGIADVVHCHVDTFVFSYVQVKWKGQVVMHYHGSIHPDEKMPRPLVDEVRDRRLGAIQIGARLDHGEYGDLAWVPMTLPVRRLAVLREQYKLPGRGGRDRPFRIAHSPTWKPIKGSDVFMTVCDRLRSKGIRVEPVMIEGHKHPQALAWKATCDACFDSFWLGLQGSGLEAGAMGLPVIAGDERTRRLHEEAIGYCPYLYADNARQLEETIVALIEHPTAYDNAASTIRRYVWHWHSYERVAAMYLNVLAERGRPELGRAIREAMKTPPDGAQVRAMRPTDPEWPWLQAPEDSVPKMTRPQGEPVRHPQREPGLWPIKNPRRYQWPEPEPMVTR